MRSIKVYLQPKFLFGISFWIHFVVHCTWVAKRTVFCRNSHKCESFVLSFFFFFSLLFESDLVMLKQIHSNFMCFLAVIPTGFLFVPLFPTCIAYIFVTFKMLLGVIQEHTLCLLRRISIQPAVAVRENRLYQQYSR